MNKLRCCKHVSTALHLLAVDINISSSMGHLCTVRVDLLLLRRRAGRRWSQCCSNEATLLPTPWQLRSISPAWPHAAQKFIQIPAVSAADTPREIQNRAHIGAGMMMLSITETIFNGWKGQLQHNSEIQPKEMKIYSSFWLEDLSQRAALDKSVQVRAQVWGSASVPMA